MRAWEVTRQDGLPLVTANASVLQGCYAMAASMPSRIKLHNIWLVCRA